MPSTPGGTHTITVRMPSRFHDAVARHAADVGVPVATYVREAVLIRCVVEHVAREKGPLTLEEVMAHFSELLEGPT